MIRAYRLYTGSDGNAHVARGSVSGGELVEADSIFFKETPPHIHRLTGTMNRDLQGPGTTESG